MVVAKLISSSVLVFGIMFPVAVFAMDPAGKVTDCTQCHKLTADEAASLLKKTGGGTVKSVKQAPIKGMFELLVEKDGKRGLIYIDYAKKHLMQGFIVDFDTLKSVTAHEQELPPFKQASHVDLSKMPVEDAVVLGNPKGTRKIYVFTDPDCPYCRKMHEELKRLAVLAPDLAIYVMLYPLPMHPNAYDKARAVMTYRNQSTLDKAFSDGVLPPVGTLDGAKELSEIMNFARRNGITATPSAVLSDGTVVAGFKTAEELQALIGAGK